MILIIIIHFSGLICEYVVNAFRPTAVKLLGLRNLTLGLNFVPPNNAAAPPPSFGS